MVVHVYFNLLLRFGVADGEAIADFDFLAFFAADAEKGADYALLVGVAAEGVVENGEYRLHSWIRKVASKVRRVEYLRLYYHIQRCCCGLPAC